MHRIRLIQTQVCIVPHLIPLLRFQLLYLQKYPRGCLLRLLRPLLNNEVGRTLRCGKLDRQIYINLKENKRGQDAAAAGINVQATLASACASVLLAVEISLRFGGQNDDTERWHATGRE